MIFEPLVDFGIHSYDNALYARNTGLLFFVVVKDNDAVMSSPKVLRAITLDKNFLDPVVHAQKL